MPLPLLLIPVAAKAGKIFAGAKAGLAAKAAIGGVAAKGVAAKGVAGAGAAKGVASMGAGALKAGAGAKAVVTKGGVVAKGVATDVAAKAVAADAAVKGAKVGLGASIAKTGKMGLMMYGGSTLYSQLKGKEAGSVEILELTEEEFIYQALESYYTEYSGVHCLAYIEVIDDFLDANPQLNKPRMEKLLALTIEWMDTDQFGTEEEIEGLVADILSGKVQKPPAGGPATGKLEVF